ncbi:uncharacterized protein VICG_00366 [Vittaforma corneae ATCC 50505]|uniref:Uncharacterized protein n=1 Tax=Vittaforma corneae (strain ATCC 50505) TaxID=993615 RepID=L2GPV0_VITCO|nr:uncharacterized protein VICG_00366 [Vittaforma corneae ATCC 50505]ELA42614.1 hypothetical protein VICG_00366 [Vittaforma corneae ATCC 50505]
MEQLNEDEIEFFEFLPMSFTNELQEALQECLNDVTQHYHLHHKIQTYISDSFKKNLFIFNSFVLRNILKFPANFKLERKVTDKTIQADISGMVEALRLKQEKVLQLSTAVQELRTKIAIQKTRNDGYRSLLQNKTKFGDLCTGAKEIKVFLRETNDLFEKYQNIGKRRDCEFEKLMEYKNIKSEYYKNERAKLLEIADFEALENLNKLI